MKFPFVLTQNVALVYFSVVKIYLTFFALQVIHCLVFSFFTWFKPIRISEQNRILLHLGRKKFYECLEPFHVAL